MAGKKHFSTLIISAILVMLVHYRIGAQAIAWVSGFTNYVVPTLLLLVYLNVSKRLFDPDASAGEEKGSQCAGLVLLGISIALFMENITLAALAVSFTMLVYGRVTKGCFSKLQISFFIGALVGAFIMFSNGAYWMIAAGEDGYRNLSGSMLDKVSGTISYYLVANNWAVLVCILLVFVYCLIVSCDGGSAEKHGKKTIAIKTLFCIIFFVLCAFSVYVVFIANSDAGKLRNALAAIMSVIFLIALFAHSIRYRSEVQGKMCIFVLATIIVLVAPLLVVNPIGPRNFFPTYALECTIACIMWDRHISDSSLMLKLVLVVIFAAVLVRWFAVYKTVFDADTARYDAVMEAVESGERSIPVSRLPYAGYVHTPDPEEGIWETRYKLFYHIPKEFDIKLG